MTKVQLEKLRVHGAEIVFRNFGGAAWHPASPEGIRSFAVVLPDSLADIFEREGYTVREFQGKRLIDIRLNHNGQTTLPDITIVDNDGYFIAVDEHNIDMLDKLEFISADLLLFPHYWSFRERSGVRLQLFEMRATVAIREH